MSVSKKNKLNVFCNSKYDFLEFFLFKVFYFLIKVYQVFISPLIPARCRFYPTCSNYAKQALTWHGGKKGSVLAIKRICRCHPLGGHGVDFVPLPLYQYQYRLYTNGLLTASFISDEDIKHKNLTNDALTIDVLTPDVSQSPIYKHGFGVYRDNISYSAWLNMMMSRT